MSSLDQHFTPAWLAERIASYLPSDAKKVVDLAAGHGSLLCAVEALAGRSFDLAAADIDPASTRVLRRLHPAWTVSHVDSLNAASYRASSAFRRMPGGYDAAILNPPFSYRGGRRQQVDYGGTSFKVTPATAFIAHAQRWIRSEGTVIAIVPENVMNIRGDEALWRAWKSRFLVETLEVLGKYTFSSARTTTMIVRLDLGLPPLADLSSRRASRAGAEAIPRSKVGCVCVDVIRGRVPVHLAKPTSSDRGVPFVHSTHLRGGEVLTSADSLEPSFATEGPFVLLPRVGTPTPTKIATTRAEAIALSDCVYGLRPSDPALVPVIRDLIVEGFDELAALYVGSCARYLTVDRLVTWLIDSGFDAQHSRPGVLAGCRCAPPTDQKLIETAS